MTKYFVILACIFLYVLQPVFSQLIDFLNTRQEGVITIIHPQKDYTISEKSIRYLIDSSVFSTKAKPDFKIYSGYSLVISQELFVKFQNELELINNIKHVKNCHKVLLEVLFSDKKKSFSITLPNFEQIERYTILMKSLLYKQGYIPFTFEDMIFENRDWKKAFQGIYMKEN